ncbi:MAG TPA: glutamate--tRNA ligase [archaeon]|nr:glutamate--tRNA ligase [archaeon]
MDLEDLIFKHALKNAFEYGKADFNSLIGKLIAAEPEIKAKLKELTPKIKEVIDKVNAMKRDEIEAQFKEFEAELRVEKKEEKKGLQKLDWAEKEPVITRYAPNPNGPFHLGNARAAILSNEYAKKYNGKFILRFEDTDPKIKKPMKDAEKVFLEDLKFLGITPDEVFFQSDRLEIYYNMIRKLIELDKIYICTMDSEQWRKLTQKKKACPERSESKEETLKKFEEMLSGKLRQGEAVIRLKTDLNHSDPSVRDFWLARAIDNPMHPRAGSKYLVWPAYNLAAAVDDHLMGITLILRGQEHEQNEEKQKFLYKYLGWIYPHSFHFGRIKLGEMVLSTSKISKGIELGEYSGWDDPRLGTIRALRRRGFQSGALKQVILDVGVKSSDTTIELKKLIDLNKKEIDKNSLRTTFIADPIELTVIGCKKKKAEFLKHPDFPEKGKRIYFLEEPIQKFFVSKKDLMKFREGGSFRLRNAFNVKLTELNEFQAKAQYLGDLSKENALHWIASGNELDAEIVMDDNSKILGLVEDFVSEARVNDFFQFEKFGYLRLDSKEKRLLFYFCHG